MQRQNSGPFQDSVPPRDNTYRAGVASPGVGGELFGIAAIGLVAIGLLTMGYSLRSGTETAQVTTPASQTSGMSQGMAQPAGTPTDPKKYQPANPSPDARSAPTSSNSGTGPASGDTGTTPANGSTEKPK